MATHEIFHLILNCAWCSPTFTMCEPWETQIFYVRILGQGGINLGSGVVSSPPAVSWRHDYEETWLVMKWLDQDIMAVIGIFATFVALLHCCGVTSLFGWNFGFLVGVIFPVSVFRSCVSGCTSFASDVVFDPILCYVLYKREQCFEEEKLNWTKPSLSSGNVGLLLYIHPYFPLYYWLAWCLIEILTRKICGSFLRTFWTFL